MSPAPLLLDTHIFLWALTEPTRLSDAVVQAIEDRSRRVYVSAASAWEIATKYRIGRLPQAQVLLEGYDRNIAKLEAESLSLSPAHCLLAGSLDWAHRDPFDRMLAAQCMIENVTLVTTDESFRHLPGLRLLP